jgi:hypothetical protein
LLQISHFSKALFGTFQSPKRLIRILSPIVQTAASCLIWCVDDVDAKLVQQVLNIPKQMWKSDIHYQSKTDDLELHFEVSKSEPLCHPAR